MAEGRHKLHGSRVVKAERRWKSKAWLNKAIKAERQDSTAQCQANGDSSGIGRCLADMPRLEIIPVDGNQLVPKSALR